MENTLISQNCKKQCNSRKMVYADESGGRRDPLCPEAFMWRSMRNMGKINPGQQLLGGR